MEKTKRKNKIAGLFGLCPIAHILLFAGLAVIAAYFLLRDDTELMARISDTAVRPYHAFMSRLCDKLPFALAELLIAAFAMLVLWYLLSSIIKLIRGPKRLGRLYKTVMSLAATFVLVYAGYCVLWGVYYYSGSFTESAGLDNGPVSTQELIAVTEYFARQADHYGELVSRDENGIYTADTDEIIAKSEQLYDKISGEIPELGAEYVRPNGARLSKGMSYIDFTGFFFPFTGEAVVNTDSPQCFLPSTVAHELSHQRGVAPEQEANFVAVVSCMSYGDTDYCYSAALLAYVYLGNALYSADRDAWSEIRASLSENVLRDLAYNSEYWQSFESPAKEISNLVYEDFLKSYGQEQGLKSYGACVDLLVNYYCERLDINA